MKKLTAAAYWDQAIHRMQKIAITKKEKESGDATDQRGKNHEKKRRDTTLIASFAAEVEKNMVSPCGHLLSDMVFLMTPFARFCMAIWAFARWAPKLLSQDQLQERVRVGRNSSPLSTATP